MNVVQVKSGVSFATIAPGGFRILSAIDQACKLAAFDIVITSACDGEHSGPDDPHHRGEAYDVRSHEFTQDEKDKFLAMVMTLLGWDRFYGFLEAAGTDNEHFHFQVAKGIQYP